MSCTNILSSGTAEPSAGASEPTGLGTLKVPSRVQLSCQVCSSGPPAPRCTDTAARRSPPRQHRARRRAQRSGIRSRPTGYKSAIRRARRPQVDLGCVADRSGLYPRSISSLVGAGSALVTVSLGRRVLCPSCSEGPTQMTQIARTSWRIFMGGMAAGFIGVVVFAGGKASADPAFPAPPIPVPVPAAAPAQAPAPPVQNLTALPGAGQQIRPDDHSAVDADSGSGARLGAFAPSRPPHARDAADGDSPRSPAPCATTCKPRASSSRHNGPRHSRRSTSSCRCPPAGLRCPTPTCPTRSR